MSAQYLLPCSCGQKVRIAVSQAGGQVSCVCGKSLSIPTLRGIRQLEPVEDRVSKPAAAWSPVQGVLFSGGMILATVGAVLMVWYLIQYARIGPFAVDLSDNFIQGGAAHIDTLSPADLLDVWTKEVLEEGLGEPEKPYWVTAKEKVAEYFWWIKLGGGAMGVGLLLAAATFLSSRRR
jgi:hypothetical protein